MTDERHQDADVGRVESHARRDATHEGDAGDGVIARIALAEVVQPGADEKQIRTRDPPGQRRRLHGRLPQVPVNGEAVVGVALGAASNGRPLRQHASDQPALVEGLDDGHQRRARAQQRHQSVARLVGPRVAGRRRAGRQLIESTPAQCGASGRGGGRGAQDQRTVASGVGGGREHHVPVAQRQPGPERAVTTGPPSSRSDQPGPHAPPRVVADERDRAGRRRHRTHEGVGNGDRLLHGAHAVVEGQTRVPDRVPEPIGHGADVPATSVQQHEVEVAVRAQLLATEAPDGHDRHIRLVTQKLGQPGVDQIGVGHAETAAGEGAVGEQRVPSSAQALYRRVRRRRCPSRRCGSE